MVAENSLDIIWLGEYELSKFAKGSKKCLKQRRATRKKYLYTVIVANTRPDGLSVAESTDSSDSNDRIDPPQSGDPDEQPSRTQVELTRERRQVSELHRRQASILANEDVPTPPQSTQSAQSLRPSEVIDLSDDSEPEIKGEPSMPEHSDKTILLVRSSNKPKRAPARVLPDADCKDIAGLFDIATTQCNMKPPAARKVSEISATFMTSGKEYLLRRSVPADWDFFYAALHKTWERDAEMFGDEGCEIEMVVDVED